MKTLTILFLGLTSIQPCLAQFIEQDSGNSRLTCAGYAPASRNESKAVDPNACDAAIEKLTELAISYGQQAEANRVQSGTIEQEVIEYHESRVRAAKVEVKAACK